MKRILRFGGPVAAVLLLLIAGSASARLCGDNVRGRDIPCGCGDTVAGSVVLTDDPVTTTRCRNNALVINAPRTAETVEVDLNGRSLHGSGRGSGIWVVSGGRNGVRIVSHSAPAVIDGFRDGIIARTRGTVSVIDNVVVSGSARDGIRVFSDGVQIRGSEARGSGRDGISVRGKRWLLKEVRAVDSRRYGINANGTAGSLGVSRAGVTAENSGRVGVHVMGSGHRVIDCVAVGGRGDGLVTSGDFHEIIGCLSLDNDGNGINSTSSQTRAQDNRAERNGGSGVLFRGHALRDAGGNRGFDNGDPRSGEPVKQCEIGGAPCR